MKIVKRNKKNKNSDQKCQKGAENSFSFLVAQSCTKQMQQIAQPKIAGPPRRGPCNLLVRFTKIIPKDSIFGSLNMAVSGKRRLGTLKPHPKNKWDTWSKHSVY